MNMRVLHVAETARGGVGTIIEQLVNNGRSDISSTILIPLQHMESVKANDSVSCFYFDRTGRDLISFLKLIKVFLKVLYKERPNVIHIHSSFAGIICRSLLIMMFFVYRPKVIYCPHAFSFMMDINKWKKKFYALIEIVLSVGTDLIICTSKYEKKLASCYGMNKKKLVVVYNSVNPPELYSRILFPYEYKKNKKNILFVGRFDHQKGMDRLVKIANVLDDDYNVYAIGDRVTNDSTILNYGKVNVIGWKCKDELARYYFYSDLVVMPSRWESFGLVAIESQSYGTPVVLARNTALTEVVVDNKTGLLVDEDSIDEYVSAIQLICTKNKEFFSGACVEFYLSEFTSENMANKVNLLYVR